MTEFDAVAKHAAVPHQAGAYRRLARETGATRGLECQAHCALVIGTRRRRWALRSQSPYSGRHAPPSSSPW